MDAVENQDSSDSFPHGLGMPIPGSTVRAMDAPPSPPTTRANTGTPARPPAKKWGLSFWMVLLGFTVLFLGVFVPVFGHTGPTREGECRRAQEGIEWMAGCLSEWENAHPDQPTLDLTEVQQALKTWEFPRPETKAFADSLEARSAKCPAGSFGLFYLLQHDPESRWHREAGPGKEARMTATFRYSRGPQDPPFELRSWDRAPMADYMRFAKRKEIMKIVSIAWLPVLLFALFVLAVVAVRRSWGGERGGKGA